MGIKKRWKRGRMTRTILEFGFVIDLVVCYDVVQQLGKDIGVAKVFDQFGVVSLAFLQKVVLAQDLLERDIRLVKKRVDGRACMEPESPEHCVLYARSMCLQALDRCRR
jgi:hypothetical protein